VQPLRGSRHDEPRNLSRMPGPEGRQNVS
jgi:hypothetical protein